MKKSVLISVGMAVAVIAATLPSDAQRGMRGVVRTDSLRVQGRVAERPDQRRFYMEPGRFSYGPQMPGRGYMWGAPGYGGHMRQFVPRPPMTYRGQRPDSIFRGQPGMNFGLRGISPALSDDQVKKIEDLRKKHQEEMTKVRDEYQEKMNSLREANRKSVESLLSDEQKKSLDKLPAPGTYGPGFRGRR